MPTHAAGVTGPRSGGGQEGTHDGRVIEMLPYLLSKTVYHSIKKNWIRKYFSKAGSDFYSLLFPSIRPSVRYLIIVISTNIKIGIQALISHEHFLPEFRPPLTEKLPRKFGTLDPHNRSLSSSAIDGTGGGNSDASRRSSNRANNSAAVKRVEPEFVTKASKSPLEARWESFRLSDIEKR